MTDTEDLTPEEFTFRIVSNGALDRCELEQSDETMILAAVYGRMLRLAVPNMEQYHGDLFHDANWMAEYVSFPGEFVWGYTPSHTSIALPTAEGVSNVLSFNDKVWHITIHVTDKGTWGATFKKLKDNTETWTEMSRYVAPDGRTVRVLKSNQGNSKSEVLE